MEAHLRDLVRRGERRVIDGATFSIAPGEAIIVTGANGAGKTTLLRAIAGFLPVETGAISVFQNGARLDDAAAVAPLSDASAAPGACSSCSS